MTFSPKAPSFVAGQQEQEATSKIGMHAFRNIVLRVNFICLCFTVCRFLCFKYCCKHTHVHRHTHKACLSEGCVKNSPSTERSSPPQAPEGTEPTKLGFRYQKCNTPTWPRQWCIPRELIVKSQTLPLVYRPTRPQRHFIHAWRSDRRQLHRAQQVLDPLLFFLLHYSYKDGEF